MSNLFHFNLYLESDIKHSIILKFAQALEKNYEIISKESGK